MEIICLVSEKTTSNCYLIEGKGHVLVIDPNDADRICSEITSHSWQPDKVLLTHEHCDHIEGLEEVRAKYQIPVLCSKVCSDGLGRPDRNLSVVYDLLVYEESGIISNVRHRSFVCRPAEETFETEISFTWEGHTFTILSCPGHSPGSCLICLDDQVWFTGDYLIPGEEVNLSLRGGSSSEYEAKTVPILKKIKPGAQICPGHGESYIR